MAVVAVGGQTLKHKIMVGRPTAEGCQPIYLLRSDTKDSPEFCGGETASRKVRKRNWHEGRLYIVESVEAERALAAFSVEPVPPRARTSGLSGEERSRCRGSNGPRNRASNS